MPSALVNNLLSTHQGKRWNQPIKVQVGNTINLKNVVGPFSDNATVRGADVRLQDSLTNKWVSPLNLQK